MLGGTDSMHEPRAPTPRIVGGSLVTPYMYPYVLRAYAASGTDGATSGFCGASLIANDWVLTAAHCLTSRTASGVNIGVHRHWIWSSYTWEHSCAEIISPRL